MKLVSLLILLITTSYAYIHHGKGWQRLSTVLDLKDDAKSSGSGKGFGKKQVQPPVGQKKSSMAPEPSVTSPSFGSQVPEEFLLLAKDDLELHATPHALEDYVPGQRKINSSNTSEFADGSSQLDDAILSSKMFKKKRAATVEAIQSKLDKLKEEEALVASDPSVGAVPEIVANRMIRRIAFFFGLPVFGGLLIFAAAIIASKKYDTTVPPGIIAYATQAPFILGLLGITYAILSSSWDDEPGSLLGIKEFKTNFQRVKDGLKRSRETATLQDEIERDADRLSGRK
eukprot:gene35780-43398_t